MIFAIMLDGDEKHRLIGNIFVRFIYELGVVYLLKRQTLGISPKVSDASWGKLELGSKQ